MKKSIIFIFLIIITGFGILTGCQRDDICPATTPTTPQLIIRFYDIEDREVLKEANNLTVIPKGSELALYLRETRDSIVIPLRTDSDTTSYRFILNDRIIQPTDSINENEDEDEPERNEDVLLFEFSRDQLYLNRACSFIINYNGVDVTLPEDFSENADSWIQDIIIDVDTITNETNAHIRIFH